MNPADSAMSQKKAHELSGNLENLMRDVEGLLKENLKLKESQGTGPVNSLHQTRERIQNHLYRTQKVLGLHNAKMVDESPA